MNGVFSNAWLRYPFVIFRLFVLVPQVAPNPVVKWPKPARFVWASGGLSSGRRHSCDHDTVSIAMMRYKRGDGRAVLGNIGRRGCNSCGGNAIGIIVVWRMRRSDILNRGRGRSAAGGGNYAALGAVLESVAHSNMLISRLRDSSPTRWCGARSMPCTYLGPIGTQDESIYVAGYAWLGRLDIPHPTCSCGTCQSCSHTFACSTLGAADCLRQHRHAPSLALS